MDIVGFRECLKCRYVICAHAHDLGVGGFKLRKVRVEVAQFLCSGSRKGLNESEDDHRALTQQISECDLLTTRGLQRKVRRLLTYLDRLGRAGKKQAGHRREKGPPNDSKWYAHSSFSLSVEDGAANSTPPYIVEKLQSVAQQLSLVKSQPPPTPPITSFA